MLLFAYMIYSDLPGSFRNFSELLIEQICACVKFMEVFVGNFEMSFSALQAAWHGTSTSIVQSSSLLAKLVLMSSSGTKVEYSWDSWLGGGVEGRRRGWRYCCIRQIESW